MKYVYVIERADDGSFSAYVPDLPGCTTSGDTMAEVRANIRTPWIPIWNPCATITSRCRPHDRSSMW
jgi:hypothetical protein